MAKPLQGHSARKRFGQNFLVDDDYIDRIIEQIAAHPDDHIVEIGPGLGAITQRLLPPNCKALAVIEIDNDLVERLKNQHDDQITIVHSDVLNVDFAELAKRITPAADGSASPMKIVGNLPYNISSPLLFHLSRFMPLISEIHVMLQKEMAQRIYAESGTKHYGRLSVMMQYHFDVALGFHLPPGAFHPPPKVDSSFIELHPRQSISLVCDDIELMSSVVNEAFQQRRKTLRNTLKNRLKDEDFEQLAIDPSQRPDALSVDDYVRISNYLSAQQHNL